MVLDSIFAAEEVTIRRLWDRSGRRRDWSVFDSSLLLTVACQEWSAFLVNIFRFCTTFGSESDRSELVTSDEENCLMSCEKLLPRLNGFTVKSSVLRDVDESLAPGASWVNIDIADVT